MTDGVTDRRNNFVLGLAQRPQVSNVAPQHSEFASGGFGRGSGIGSGALAEGRLCAVDDCCADVHLLVD